MIKKVLVAIVLLVGLTSCQKEESLALEGIPHDADKCPGDHTDTFSCRPFEHREEDGSLSPEQQLQNYTQEAINSGPKQKTQNLTSSVCTFRHEGYRYVIMSNIFQVYDDNGYLGETTITNGQSYWYCFVFA